MWDFTVKSEQHSAASQDFCEYQYLDCCDFAAVPQLYGGQKEKWLLLVAVKFHSMHGCTQKHSQFKKKMCPAPGNDEKYGAVTI